MVLTHSNSQIWLEILQRPAIHFCYSSSLWSAINSLRKAFLLILTLEIRQNILAILYVPLNYFNLVWET